jgi:hypothetical protein
MPGRIWQSFGIFSSLFVLAACSEQASLPTQQRPSPSETSAAKSAGGNTQVNVTTTVADDPGFQVRSDGLGAYANSRTVSDIIQAIGDWALDLTGSTRGIYLDFTRGIPGSGPNGGAPVAIPSQTYRVFAIARCHLYNNDFKTIAPAQTVTCPLHFAQFFVGTQEYFVQMNPFEGTDGSIFPETNYVNVTCNSATAPCKSWTITPSGTAPDGSSANVVALMTITTTTVKGKTTTTQAKQGDFYMSFRMDVTNP